MAPTAGQLAILGDNALENRGRIRRHIGLAPQDIALYEALSARENLSYFGRMYGLKGAALQERVATCLEAVGLTPQADQRVGGFFRRDETAGQSGRGHHS